MPAPAFESLRFTQAYRVSFWGWALLTGAAGFFVLAIAAVMMYSIVAPLEERELREHYGDEYAEYQRVVPRFIPRLRRTARPGGR